MKNKYFYKLKVSFKGTRYLGWQIQKDFHPTVQGTLNNACSEIFKSKEIKTIGSGRTDSGVHSLGHIVKLEAPFEIDHMGLLKGLNSILPDDIRVLEIDRCKENFLPTNHAKNKTYKYLFTNDQIHNPFQVDSIANFRFELEVDAMKKACELFVGEHDFKDFECTGSDVSSTTRTIYKCDLYYQNVDMHGVMNGHWVVEINGNGFLKQMVRLIVGTIWNVGRGKTTLLEIENSLKTPSGKRLGAVAPACGLYKVSVEY